MFSTDFVMLLVDVKHYISANFKKNIRYISLIINDYIFEIVEKSSCCLTQKFCERKLSSHMLEMFKFTLNIVITAKIICQYKYK